MSRFVGGQAPAGYTGSGPVKPPTGTRGPIKPKPGKPGPSTGGRGTTQPVPTRPTGKPGPSTKQIAALNKRIDADIMREKARALKFKEMIAKKKAAAKKK